MQRQVQEFTRVNYPNANANEKTQASTQRMKKKKHVLKLTFAFAFASQSEPETQIQAQGEKRRFHRFYATTRWRQRLSPFRKKNLWRVRKRRPLIRPFLRPTAKCLAILGSAIIAKVSTDILKSH